MKQQTAHIVPGIPLFISAFLIISLFLVISPPGTQGAALTMDVRPENTTVLHNSDGRSSIQIRVVAPDEIPLDDRPLLNLSLVLDKSGSMADSGKISYLIQAAHMFIDRLGPDDILSIVTYDNLVRVPVSARKVRDRELFHRAVDRLYPGGRTYLSGGLEEGYRQVRKNRRKSYINRVILLSDGLANIGVTNNMELRRRTSSMYENGVSVSTFGMGLDFDEDLLSSVAYGSGGNYHYIARPDDILSALGREFHTVSRTVASGVQIIIRPLDGCRFESVPGHSWRMEKDAAVIGLGDLSAGETRTLMAKVSVPTRDIGSRDIADISVHYLNPRTGKTDRQDPGLIKLLIVDDPGVHRKNLDPEVQGNRAVIESSAMMDVAAKKVDEGDRDGAITILKKALDSLVNAPESPTVKDEIQRLRNYSVDLEHMDEMAPSAQEEIQKEIKYRNYQELHQQ